MNWKCAKYDEKKPHTCQSQSSLVFSRCRWLFLHWIVHPRASPAIIFIHPTTKLEKSSFINKMTKVVFEKLISFCIFRLLDLFFANIFFIYSNLTYNIFPCHHLFVSLRTWMDGEWEYMRMTGCLPPLPINSHDSRTLPITTFSLTTTSTIFLLIFS